MRYKSLVTFGCILGMLIMACSGMTEAEIEAIVEARLAEERIIISGDFTAQYLSDWTGGVDICVPGFNLGEQANNSFTRSRAYVCPHRHSETRSRYGSS